MYIVCFDLEGVFTPEVWVKVAEKTGIPDLRLTTRDIANYDVLMKKRLEILEQNNITLSYIQSIIENMDLLPGALEFLNWLRSKVQVILLSDTFQEFGMLFMKKLGYPTLFCHNLLVDENNFIKNYNIRITDQKAKTVRALKQLNYNIIATGDSYNDTTMLEEADHGILYCPPQNVIDEFPHLPVAFSYEEIKKLLKKWIPRLQ